MPVTVPLGSECASRTSAAGTRLGHFEKIILVAGDAPGVAGGPSVSFADFALFHIFDAAASQFPTTFAAAAVPSVKAFHAKFAARPNLKSYQASDRCPKWAGDSVTSTRAPLIALLFFAHCTSILRQPLFFLDQSNYLNTLWSAHCPCTMVLPRLMMITTPVLSKYR